MKLPAEWSDILTDFQNSIRASISDEKSQTDVQLLQFNTTNRASIQVPYCTEFRDLSSVMKFCVDFCAHINTKKNKKVTYFAGKMNLEQAFLAYASYQQENDQGNAR